MRALKRLPRASSGPDDLFPELIEILLDGWSSPRTPPRGADPAEAFRIFWLSDADFRRAWQTHRAALLAEWRRRGKPGRPWAADQFEPRT